MTSLAKCLQNFGEPLSESERKTLLQNASDLRDQGLSDRHASVRAIDQMLDDFYAERETLAEAVENAGGTPAAEPERAKVEQEKPARRRGRRLDKLALPAEVVEGPDGTRYTVSLTAKEAVSTIDSRISELNKLMRCLHGA